MKHLSLNLFLFVSVSFAVFASFFAGAEADAAEVNLMSIPPRFRKVLVLFSAETAKEDRDAFLTGLEEAKLRHRQDYYEIVRKWRETTPAAPEKKELRGQGTASDKTSETGSLTEHDVERETYHNPWFLDVVDVLMISTEKKDPFFDIESKDSRLWDMTDLVRRPEWDEGYDALIVAASDELADETTRLIRQGVFGLSPKYGLAVLFAGVSSFDESIRKPQDGKSKAPYAFAIRHPVDPWPNTNLALSAFPKTKKVVLLTSGKVWSEEKETAYRAKLGPAKTLKTIPIPEIPKCDVTETDIREMKDKFIASLKAEIQPDTVIVSLSSVEHGQDPVEWLPDDFDACPVFADTPPARKNEVGGFCRSMNKLALQTADLLEDLSKDSLCLTGKSVPATIAESDDLWINEAALKHYKLKLNEFQNDAILANTTTKKAPQRRVYPTWTKKRIFALLAANAAVLFGLTMMTLFSIRARRRRRVLSEKIYESLPARVLVTDREGRIIDYHMQFGGVEQKGELLWKNINEVPWLRDIGMDRAVREAFDSGKTIVREFEIDGERRVVVLTSTPSDVFGRAAVVAVSNDTPQHA